MNTKTKHVVLTLLLSVLLFGASLVCILKPADEYSDSERRVLAQLPELTVETIFNGKFVSELEKYTQDQFPLRDTFRSIKALASEYLFLKSDNNKLFQTDGHLSKLEYPLNQPMLEHAAERFQFLYDRYLKDLDADLYLAVVPDKNYYLAEDNGYLALDYAELMDTMAELTPYLTPIDLTDCLDAGSYYYTDTHWRQEKLQAVLARLSEEMGVTLDDKYVENTLDNPFYGVYYGQAALPVEPDTLIYLTGGALDGCTVTSYATGTPVESVIYNMEKAQSKDPYEIFLSGTQPLLVIENPNAETERELILFRDSFGSSLAPLLAEGYSKITVVDTRYVNSAFLGSLVDFSEKAGREVDVLFLYSTILLNSSLAMN